MRLERSKGGKGGLKDFPDEKKSLEKIDIKKKREEEKGRIVLE